MLKWDDVVVTMAPKLEIVEFVSPPLEPVYKAYDVCLICQMIHSCPNQEDVDKAVSLLTYCFVNLEVKR